MPYVSREPLLRLTEKIEPTRSDTCLARAGAGLLMESEAFTQEIWAAADRAEALGYGPLTIHEAVFAAWDIRRLPVPYEEYFRRVYGEPD